MLFLLIIDNNAFAENRSYRLSVDAVEFYAYLLYRQELSVLLEN